MRGLLGLAGFPEPVKVEPLAGTRLGEREVPWREFQCWRESGEEGGREGQGTGSGSSSRRRPGAGGDVVWGAFWDGGIWSGCLPTDSKQSNKK